MFLREVDELIQRDDPCATTPSDDLLQSDDAFGGRLDDASLVFAFTYLPESEHEEPSPPLWYFTLTADQISEIASGKLSKLDMWRCVTDCGSRGTEPDYYCSRCP